MAKLKISAPWVTFYNEMEAFFKEDPEVHVVYDEETYAVELYVDNAAKASALEQVLVKEKTFGNITQTVTVIPANSMGAPTKEFLFKNALDRNPALSYIQTVNGIFMNGLTYVVFINKVVQYWNDDIGDVNGLCSTLYQDIAADIFKDRPGVFFCTDVPTEGGSLGKPLGEWP